jgi:putative copper export protein
MNFLFAITRALHFASLMTLFGACTFAWIVQRRLRREADLPRALLLSCGGVALATALISVAFVASEMTNSLQAAFTPATLGEVLLHTRYGWVTLARTALLAAILPTVWSPPPALRGAGSIFGGVALALLGLTSHAAASGGVQYALPRAAVDALHLLAGGFWIGGVAVLVFAVRRAPRDTQGHITLLRLFSRWAAIAVVVLVVAGTINAFAILDIQGMRWSAAYLAWLAVKLALAGIMVALALTNRLGVLPGLVRGEANAAETLPLTLTAELAVAGLILLCVGFLGLTAPMAM